MIATRAIALAGALVATTCVAKAQSVQLYGTVYVKSGAAQPVPLAYVRVFLDGDAGSIGPVLTDAAGHFAFDDTAPGRYRLRILSGANSLVLWTQPVIVPGRLSPIVIRQ